MPNTFKRPVLNSTYVIIGYLLSPLSWWNDVFVNIPLAYVFAIPFSMLEERLFLPMLILGYWISNLLGFIILHHGINGLFSSHHKINFVRQIIITIVYTLVIVVLVLFNWISLPKELLDS